MLSPSPSSTSHLDAATLKRAKGVIFFTVFLDLLGFGIILPQLAVYAAQFGASPQVAGILAASYSAMSFLSAPMLGALSDRIGRRPVIVVSIFGTALGYLLFGFAGSLWMLFASRIIDGVSAGNISTAQAYLSDITPPEERTKTFGLFGAVFGVGFALGPLIGTLLSYLPGQFGGNLGLGLFAATLSFINFALAIKILPETLSPAIRAQNNAPGAPKRAFFNLGGFQRALGQKGLNVAIVVGFLVTAAFATLQGTYALFILKEYARPQIQGQIRADPSRAITQAHQLLDKQEADDTNAAAGFAPQTGSSLSATQQDLRKPYPQSLGGNFDLPQAAPAGLTWSEIEKVLVRPQTARMVSILFALIGVCSLLVQGGLMRTLPKRVGEVPLVLSGTLLMALGLFLIPFPSAFWGQLLVCALLTLGNGICTPVLTALVSGLAPEAQRGEIIGVYQSTQSLGRVVGPILGGFLFGSIASGAPYIAGGIIMFGAFLLAFRLRGAVATIPKQATI